MFSIFREMQVSRLEENGLRCLLQVALCSPLRVISAREIADYEQLPLVDVRRAMSLLERGALVHSLDSRGFQLARAASGITVWEAMTALGGECEILVRHPRRAFDEHESFQPISVTALQLSLRLQAMLREILEEISLEDLCIAMQLGVLPDDVSYSPYVN